MDDQRSVPWLGLYVFGGVLLTASSAVPWWMDEGAFALDTVWARVAVFCGVVITGIGVLMLRGALRRDVIFIVPVVLFVSLVAFYLRVVKNQFSDWEFTRFVEIGFFIALVGFGCAAVSAIAVLSRAPSPLWLPVSSLVVIAVCVAALHSWTRANAIEITRTPPELKELTADTSTHLCRYPRVRPTYLPWDKGGSISKPRRSYDTDIERAALIWTNPDNADESVALTIYPLPGGSTPEEPIGVIIEGAEGYLHRGSVGEHSAWWNLDQRCNFLELSVSLAEVKPSGVDREVVKIARSLR